MSLPELDHKESAQFIPAMIENDTLIDVLEKDDLVSCLQSIKLNPDQSTYVVQKSKDKYDTKGTLEIIQSISTDFGEEDQINNESVAKYLHHIGIALKLSSLKCISDMFISLDIEFKNLMNKCKNLEISETSLGMKLDTRNRQIIYLTSMLERQKSMCESLNDKNQELKANIELLESQIKELNKEKQLMQRKLMRKPESENKNIKAMKQIPKIDQNFEKIFDVFKICAEEGDDQAIEFGVREKYYCVSDRSRNNMLTKAAYCSNFRLAKMLVEAGVDPASIADDGITALWWFCAKGKLEAVMYFASLPGVNPSAMRFDRCSTLMIAASEGHYDVVEYLISIGVDVNAKTLFGQSALSMTSNTRIKNLLRMNGAREW